jgi:hypothetical protein
MKKNDHLQGIEGQFANGGIFRTQVGRAVRMKIAGSVVREDTRQGKLHFHCSNVLVKIRISGFSVSER